MLGLYVAVGTLLLMLSSFYRGGRCAVVWPVVAERSERNPITAFRQGWALTKDNGWRIFLFLFLVALVTMIVAMIFGGIIMAISGTKEGVGHNVSGLVEGGIAEVDGLVTRAVQAETSRQLATGNAGGGLGGTDT